MNCEVMQLRLAYNPKYAFYNISNGLLGMKRDLFTKLMTKIPIAGKRMVLFLFILLFF
jgi:hypothetical protein